ncbi:response regulator transcription factor [Levilactobacillus zymae]|uniref:response regulator transcription factor n=1 Tax=Levilactobacillus zymae TaxID=267363 RepID=UPI003FCE6600
MMNRVGILGRTNTLKDRVAFLVNQQPNCAVTTRLTAWSELQVALPTLDVLIVIAPDYTEDLMTLAHAYLDPLDPTTQVVALGNLCSKHLAEDYLAQGIAAYILADSPNHEIVWALQSVLDGQAYLDAQIDPCPTREQLHNDNYTRLSKREIEVFPLMVLGYSNKSIATRLYISPKTVEAHKASIMHKLNIHSRPELVRYALNNNLINA